MTDARTALNHPAVRIAVAAVAVSTAALPSVNAPQFTGPDTDVRSLVGATIQIQEDTARTTVAFHLTNSSWREILDPAASLDSKLCALENLCAEGAAGLPSFVANRLNGTRLNLRWRAALVQTAERTQGNDQDTRALMASGLFRSALVFRDAQQSWTDGSLWAAVRTLGGLMRVEQAGVLLAFLRTEDRLQTRQVALQALQNMLARYEDGWRHLPGEVKARVAQLADTYLNADVLVSGENVALAANTCCAAFLANVENVEGLRTRLRALGRPALERQISLADARARGQSGA